MTNDFIHYFPLGRQVLPVSDPGQEDLDPGVRQDQGRVAPAQLRLAQAEVLRYVGLDHAEGLPEEVGDEVTEPEEGECQELVTEDGHLLSSGRGDSLIRDGGGEAVITLSNTIVVQEQDLSLSSHRGQARAERGWS